MQFKRQLLGCRCKQSDENDGDMMATTMRTIRARREITNEVWFTTEHFPFQDWFWNRRGFERTPQAVIGAPLPRQFVSKWCCLWNS
jgi:hypothetical protein